MAILHSAQLRPSKIELVSSWAFTQPWFEGEQGDLTSVGAFRFDDPDGEVGIETLLVRAGDGPVLQVPLTYRAAPLEGGEAWLITTMQHSVLGERWVYDAVGDPVYLAAVANTIVDGGRQAELQVLVDGELVRREPTVLVRGTGTDGDPVAPVPVSEISVRHEEGATVVHARDLRLEIARTLAADASGRDELEGGALTGTWSGQDASRVLVRMLG